MRGQFQFFGVFLHLVHAGKYNRKEAARTVILLKEKGLDNYDDLVAYTENLSSRFSELSDSIKAAEKRMIEVQALQKHIKNYHNTRQVYVEYRKSGYSKKFFEEHRQEITLHQAAKKLLMNFRFQNFPLVSHCMKNSIVWQCRRKKIMQSIVKCEKKKKNC